MDLREKVVVITGASSGIGRAAAVQFAARGSRLVLGARREDALAETARLCRAAGGEAFIRLTDVTKEADVNALCEFAVEQAGGIDVWVNNAGVTLFSPLDQGPFEEHRRVIETNLYGPIFAARAVVPIFRRQKRGIMINVGSILSKVGQPFVPSYVISKFALRGMSEALRVELADELDVHVCSLLPYASDTEHFESGANELGRDAHAMPPVQSPEKVAAAIVDLAVHPRREVHLPRYAPLGLALHFVLPRATERLLLEVLGKWHFGGAPEPSTTGNLYEPMRPDGAVHGDRQARLTGFTLMLYALRRFPQLQLDIMRHSLTAAPPAFRHWLARRRFGRHGRVVHPLA
jgi:NAD(P)-dependent dehydrogenase (short-subunit alcohol dehydrogenase family)